MPQCQHIDHTYEVRAGKQTLYRGDDVQETVRVLEERRSNPRARAVVALIASGPEGDCCYEESGRVLDL